MHKAPEPLVWPPKLPRKFPLSLAFRDGQAIGYSKWGIGWVCGKKSPAEALSIYHDKARRRLENRPLAPIDAAIGDQQLVEQLAERYVAARARDAAAGQIRHAHYQAIERAIALLLEHTLSADLPGG